MSSKAIVDPFDKLYSLAEHSREVARPLPQLSIASLWGGIKVRIKDKTVILPLTDIKEILYSLEVTPVAGVVPWVLGVMNLRGELCGVTDLQGYLFEREDEIKSTARVALVEGPKGVYGFLIDEIIGLEYFQPEKVVSCQEDIPYARDARLSQDGRIWPVLNVKLLVEDERLLSIGLDEKGEVINLGDEKNVG
ncbi:MAG: hypothetical protein CMF48_00945 [Legionellales bacterium]|nr:hypothetical protein [Legionellales bacterium]|tara:strand:+ start:111 stop:689 length:579 start_codon:yes stop_codon:yes gene_type:complete